MNMDTFCCFLIQFNSIQKNFFFFHKMWAIIITDEMICTAALGLLELLLLSRLSTDFAAFPANLHCLLHAWNFCVHVQIPFLRKTLSTFFTPIRFNDCESRKKYVSPERLWSDILLLKLQVRVWIRR